MLIGGNMAVADYKVVVVQSSGKKEAIVDIARLEYTDIINQMRTFSVTIGKANKNDYSKFNSYEVVSGVETGVIYIYRKGNLELAGIIEKPTYDKFGRLVLKGVGMEVKIEWKGTGINKIYSNIGLDTIVSDMIGDISGIDLGTNEASSKGNLKEVNISGMSYLDGLNHAIVDLGGNEWYMTYSDSGNSSFNNVQYRGSSSSIGTLVEGIDISNVQRTKDTQRIFNKVTAIGRSEGETLISVTRQATDVDASYDMSKYGTREPPKPLVNKRIQTEEDLTKYADNFLKQHMYPIEVINFDMNDVDYPCSVGDVVTIRSGAKLQEGGEEYKRELRIISKKRIVTPNSERLIIGVTRKGLNTLPTDISTRWKRIEDIIISHQTTNQLENEYLNKNKDQTLTGNLLLNGNFPIRLEPSTGNIGFSSDKVKYIFCEHLTTNNLNVNMSGSDELSVNGTSYLNGQVDLGSHKIVNVADPTADQDVATKKYVDDHVGSDIWETYGDSNIRPKSAKNIIPYSTGQNLGQPGTSITWTILYLYDKLVLPSGDIRDESGRISFFINGSRYAYVNSAGFTVGKLFVKDTTQTLCEIKKDGTIDVKIEAMATGSDLILRGQDSVKVEGKLKIPVGTNLY